MWNWIKRLLAPPVFASDEDKTTSAALLHVLLLILLVGDVLFALSIAPLGFPPQLVAIVVYIFLSAMGLMVLLRRGHTRITVIVLTLVLYVGFTLPMLSYGGLHDTAILGYLVIIIMAAIGGDQLILGGTVLLILATVAGTYYAENSGLITPDVPLPTQIHDLGLLLIFFSLSGGLLGYTMRRMRLAYQQARDSAQVVAQRNLELARSRDELAAQAQTLERRAHYLEASAIIANEAANVGGDIEQFLARIVETIGRQLGFYHVGLFMVDSSREQVELRAASGAAVLYTGGPRNPAPGLRLRMGEGLVGIAAQQETYRLAQDVQQDTAFSPSPDLPETRAELALPLRVRGQIMGVLDIQSSQVGAFGDEDLIILRTLADQLAVTIDNAQLQLQVQDSIQTERRTLGQLSAQAWQQVIRTQTGLSVSSQEEGLVPADVLRPEMQTSLTQEQLSFNEQDKTALALPIKVRDQVIGVIGGRKPDDAPEWTSEEIEMLQTLTEQIALALESARLYQDTQRRAARERLLGEVTARVRETLDVEAVLRTAAGEMRRALDLEELVVRLTAPEARVGDQAVGIERIDEST